LARPCGVEVFEAFMTDRQTAIALLNAMFASDALGLCQFNSDGVVIMVEGSARDWAPPVGRHIDEAPLFVGMMDEILAVRETGKPIAIAGVAIGGESAAAIDIDILWLADVSRFAAMAKSADERLRQQRAATQFVRDHRLLEQKVAEQGAKIAEQAEMMALFVRHVPAAVAMLDDQLDVLMASERWKQEHGDPAKAPANGETASPLTWPRVRGELALAMEGGVPTARMEKATVQGRTTWKRLAQAPWRRTNHEIGGTILFCEDVTDAMRKAENLRARVDDLHKLGTEMDKLGHAVTNDLRAPMRQIDFFSRFLLDNELPRLDGASRDYLQQIRACSERIDRMMVALQRYLRLSESDISLAPFNIGDAVRAAATNMRDDLAKGRVFVTLRESLAIEGDLSLISEMFERLFDNVVKYAGEGATVVIECFEEADGVLVQVTDDGPGIEAHLRRRAFDFFDRLNAPASIPGEGMGLAECRKIVDLHGGAMTLDQEFDGGLRALISLPRKARRVAAPRPTSIRA
jgi:signal transduction histidine kinase